MLPESGKGSLYHLTVTDHILGQPSAIIPHFIYRVNFNSQQRANSALRCYASGHSGEPETALSNVMPASHTLP